MSEETKIVEAAKEPPVLPKMGYTRFLAFVSFFYSIWYIQMNPEPSSVVLIYLGFIVAQWALGRVTILEGLKIWKSK